MMNIHVIWLQRLLLAILCSSDTCSWDRYLGDALSWQCLVLATPSWFSSLIFDFTWKGKQRQMYLNLFSPTPAHGEEGLFKFFSPTLSYGEEGLSQLFSPTLAYGEEGLSKLFSPAFAHGEED